MLRISASLTRVSAGALGAVIAAPPMKAILCLLFAVASTASLFAEKAVILTQEGSPLVISSYTATYQREVRGSYASHSDQIVHALVLKNSATKAIVAYRIGLGAFDTFNNFMGKFSGVSIEMVIPGSAVKGSWAQDPYAAFLFEKYGTGVAYVSEVRFDDGTFWRADMDSILAQMQQFEASLDKSDLADKKGK